MNLAEKFLKALKNATNKHAQSILFNLEGVDYERQFKRYYLILYYRDFLSHEIKFTFAGYGRSWTRTKR